MLNANRQAAHPVRQGPDYHAVSTAWAVKVLRSLHAAGKSLAPSDVRRCQDYATEVFGDRKFAPWLLVYTAVSGSFKEGWIPDNFYRTRVVPAIQGRHGRVSLLKSLNAALFDSPAFPDLGSKINGSLFDRISRPLCFDEARARFFEAGERVIFKPDETGRGKGIRVFNEGSFDRGTFERLGNGVFQRFVTQHTDFDRFARSSVATVRLTTVVEDSGEIAPRAGYLRLGTGADTHIRSASQMRVPLDLGTGALRETGLDANWLECSAHPTSGEPFTGKQVPAFKQCLATVLSHHRKVQFVGAVGWDLAVDSEGDVQVLEWNAFHNGITFSEANQGPCFTGLGWERFAGAA